MAIFALMAQAFITFYLIAIFHVTMQQQLLFINQKIHWGFWSYAGTKPLIKRQDHRPAYTPKPPLSLGLAPTEQY
ncbi:MAG: hypothetical protein ACYT04_42835 [Nostoc sp.]